MAEHDLFVLHAEADTSFVEHLLRTLGFTGDDPRVVLPGRYELGQPTIDEMCRYIASSRCTVLVVSAAAAVDRWLEHGRVLAATPSDGGASWRLVPLRLDDTPLHSSLTGIVALDYRSGSDWDAQSRRLSQHLMRPEAPRATLRCPYPGLEPYRVEDVGRFFGREDEIERLVRDVESRDRPLCVIGPSGSGKSSLLQAGVLPRLRRHSELRPRYVTRVMRPGETPGAQLLEAVGAGASTAAAAALDGLLRATGCARLVLVVDQLEELFTLAKEAEAARFLEVWRELRADPRCLLVAALRADFIGSLMESELWSDLGTNKFEVIPLRGAALARAIRQPAAAAGVHLRDVLVERLVDDAARAPGAMPLVQATLLGLWERLERGGVDGGPRRELTVADYEELVGDHGGIASAIARRADDAIRWFTPSQYALAQRVLLRLIRFGEGRSHTRQPQRLAALAEGEDPDDFDEVVATLVGRWLLTADRDAASAGIVTLAHDALISSWPRLREWIEAGRADEETRRVIESQVAAWRRDGDAKLMDPIEIAAASHWLAQSPGRAQLVPGAAELVARSRAALEEIRRQRDHAHRLLAQSYLEHGRRHLVRRRPMRALPYFVAAREVDVARGAPSAPTSLQMLFAEAARSLPVAAVVHPERVRSASFSADGRHLLTAGDDCHVRVWDAATGAAARALAVPAAVLDARFSPDGQRIAIACSDHRVYLRDVGSGAAIGDPLRHDGRVHLVRWSPDGASLLTAAWDRTARVWDPISGCPRTKPLRHDGQIRQVGWSADGHRVVIAGRGARIHDASTGAVIVTLHEGSIVRQADLSGDDTRIVLAGSARSALVCDARTGSTIAELPCEAAVTAARWHPDGRRIATAANEVAMVWQADDGVAVTRPIKHDRRITDLAWSSDGRRVATASLDRTARVSDAETGEPMAAPFEHSREVHGLAFDPRDRCLVTFGAGPVAQVWDTERTHPVPRALEHERKWVASVAFDRAGTRVITAGADRTARTWDTDTGLALSPALRHDTEVMSASFSHDGGRVVTIAGNAAWLWDPATGARLHAFAHTDRIATAAFAPDDARIVTAGADGRVKVWDTMTGARSIEHVHPRAVTGAWWSPDGARLLSACADGHARLWHGDDVVLLAHADTVTHAAFDPRGRQIATAGKDRVAQIWDVASSACVRSLRHDDEVRRVVFGPDGTRLVTLAGNTARVWDAASGRLAIEPIEQRGRIHAATFSPDGALLAVGGEDGNVELWDLALGKALTAPLAHASRVNRIAFHQDGERLAIAGGTPSARLWALALDHRSLELWLETARRCPYELVDGVLVEREPVSTV